MIKNKSRGMLVGLAVGDALGAPVEFGCTSKSITEMIDTVKDFHDTNIPKGVWTDDTSMALCLADSLLECNGYDSWDVMDKYAKWESSGYRCYFDMGFGVGSQTDNAITHYINSDVIIHKEEKRGYMAGNGSIMRLTPVVIAANKTQAIKDVIRLAQISARETHYSVEAEAGAEIFAAMLYGALRLKDKEKIVDVSSFSTGATYDFIFEQVTKKWNRELLLDLGGYVVDALKIAVWAFLNFDNFEIGVLEVIKLGGDTDTNAAIYGQLAGAYYGYNAIPKRWKKDLYLHDEIVELADKLLSMKSCPVIETRFEEDNDPDSTKPNIYLDIDGVILGAESPKKDCEEFITFIMDNFPNNAYWLTTHVKGGQNNTRQSLGSVYPNLIDRMQEVFKNTDWGVHKTDAIDFSKPFIWFDDDLYQGEEDILVSHGVLDNHHKMNPRDPKAVRKAIDRLEASEF
jgi:ADP-ribosyl-[dinitrogen reductase] hydrolase